MCFVTVTMRMILRMTMIGREIGHSSVELSGSCSDRSEWDLLTWTFPSWFRWGWWRRWILWIITKIPSWSYKYFNRVKIVSFGSSSIITISVSFFVKTSSMVNKSSITLSNTSFLICFVVCFKVAAKLMPNQCRIDAKLLAAGFMTDWCQFESKMVLTLWVLFVIIFHNSLWTQHVDFEKSGFYLKSHIWNTLKNGHNLRVETISSCLVSSVYLSSFDSNSIARSN